MAVYHRGKVEVVAKKSKSKSPSSVTLYRETMIREVQLMASAIETLMQVPEALKVLAGATSPLAQISFKFVDGEAFTANEIPFDPSVN